LLCRCEGVTAARIDALIADGVADPGSLKRATRAGMGRCQGRGCTPLIAARLGAAAGDGFAPRPPLRPLPIAAIAALAPD
jgi:bacterioferritin-associated ferredoxin